MFRVGILTVSDKGHAGERHDASGPGAGPLAAGRRFPQVAATASVPDELRPSPPNCWPGATGNGWT